MIQMISYTVRQDRGYFSPRLIPHLDLADLNLSDNLFRLYFSMLDDSLRSVVLDTEDGVGRLGRSSEFMMMYFQGDKIFFKHISSRNYIHMNRFTGELFIPKSDRAFGRGLFDLGGWENPVVWRVFLRSKGLESWKEKSLSEYLGS